VALERYMIGTLQKVIMVTEWGYNSDIIMIYNSDVRIICDSDIRKDYSRLITLTSEWWYNTDVIGIYNNDDERYVTVTL